MKKYQANICIDISHKLVCAYLHKHIINMFM